MGAATMQKHEERVAAIEAVMPGLKETRGWVILGILAGLGMIGAGVLKLVVFA
jgi:hypothetical protein